MAESDRRLVILHFNDVYNIEPSTREPVGGASRLAYRVSTVTRANVYWRLGYAYEDTHTHQRNEERGGWIVTDGATAYRHPMHPHTQVKSLQAERPLVVFSGDAFNPSMLSTLTLGAQMPPILNEIGVHVAAIGNHDFDFGVTQLMSLTKQCNFPWLMANVLDRETGKLLSGIHDE